MTDYLIEPATGKRVSEVEVLRHVFVYDPHSGIETEEYYEVQMPNMAVPMVAYSEELEIGDE